jgi:hypothetical protein
MAPAKEQGGAGQYAHERLKQHEALVQLGAAKRPDPALRVPERDR